MKKPKNRNFELNQVLRSHRCEVYKDKKKENRKRACRGAVNY